LVSVDGWDEDGAIKVFVAALTGGFGDEEAGVAGGFVQGGALAGKALEAGVFCAEGIRGAALNLFERSGEMSAELVGGAEANQPAEGAFAVGAEV